MRWISDSQAEAPLKPVVAQMLMLRGKRPESSSEERLIAGKVAFKIGDFATVIEMLGKEPEQHCVTPDDWFVLANSFLMKGDHETALSTARAGQAAAGNSAPLEATLARALLKCGDIEGATSAYYKVAELGQVDEGVFQLLKIAARTHDGEALLGQVNQFEQRFGPSTVIHAHRAIAYSMLGNDTSASTLVDLDRQVKQRSISELFSGAELREFHRELIEETKAAMPLSDDQYAQIEYRPNVDHMPAMQILRQWACTVYEDYLAQLDTDRESAWFEPNLADVSLLYSVTKLRNEAKNGQHVHRQSILAGVYHLLVADDILDATDDRGCLEIGNVDQHTEGHQAIWGKRLVKPKPGHFTMFPAHIFHDVVPTHSSALRISIPMDVRVIKRTTKG